MPSSPAFAWPLWGVFGPTPGRWARGCRQLLGPRVRSSPTRRGCSPCRTADARSCAQHTAGQDDVSGDVRVQLHVAQEAAEAVRHHVERVLADSTHSAESVIENHLPLLHIASAVRPLQVFGQGERPVTHDNVGALHNGARQFTGRWDVSNSLLYALI